jgi:hypothetical protein
MRSCASGASQSKVGWEFLNGDAWVSKRNLLVIRGRAGAHPYRPGFAVPYLFRLLTFSDHDSKSVAFN